MKTVVWEGRTMDKGRFSRRKFLGLSAAVGFGVTGAPLLSSCSKDLPEVDKDKAIIEAKKLEPNSAFTFVDVGTEKSYVLVHLDSGEFAMYSAECTHRGCTVMYKAEEQHLVCPCHNSTFSLEGGYVVSGPAEEPLPELAVRIENGKVVSA